MVGTRHAVSEKQEQSGLGMPSPYIPEREQIQDRKAGLKRKSANATIQFLPRRGEGVDKLSAHSCRNEVCDPSSASVKHDREYNFALFAHSA